MTVRGRTGVEHFDRAIMEAIAAEFLDYPEPSDPNEKLPRQLDHPVRQTHIEGIKGSGVDGRVVTVWNWPDSIYNQYVLPGIRVSRAPGIMKDERREQPFKSGKKYRVPTPDAEYLEIPTSRGIVSGYTKYAERGHAKPVTLTYDIEVRARDPKPANDMMEYILTELPDRSFLPVFDSHDEPSSYTIFWEDSQETGEVAGSLNRFSGWIITYRVEAELDFEKEYEVTTATKRPNTQGRVLTGED